MGPLVSIVTPTFNAGPHVEQAILSVMAQDYPRVEHIVIDGGSTDDTLSIVRKYEKRIVWISEKDTGIYNAINKGLRIAKGEIQCFLSADDLYLPWTTRKVVESFEKHPQADVIYGDGIVSSMDGSHGIVYFNPPASKVRKFLSIGTIFTNPSFWKRRVFQYLSGYDEQFRIAGDYDFMIRASRRFKFRKIQEVLAIWRFRKASLTASIGKLADENERIKAKNFGPMSLHNNRRRDLELARLSASYWLPDLGRLLAESWNNGEASREWKELIQTRSLSRLRLMRDFLSAPLVPALLTSALRTKFFPGYVDMNKLVRISTKEL
ncbi:MAG: glycosyltransferase family 2 protein [Nitrososphaerales archaeon]